MRLPFSRLQSFRMTAICMTAVSAMILASPPAALAMVVPINHAERIDIRGFAASVVVGNTSIASVTVVDAHTIYIMGRGAGSTNVIVLDKSGRTLFTGDVTVGSGGSRVSLYRGDKRTEVNCAYGCVEMSDGDKASNGNPRALGPGGAGMMGAAPGPMAP